MTLTKRRAPNERVPREFFRAVAYGVAIRYRATGSQATSAYTRVPALLVRADLVGGTVGADYALWATVWRVP